MASLKNCVFALGFFDALHIGHMYVLERAKKIADKFNTTVKVLTFGDDFLQKIYKDSEEIYLLDERRFLLKKFGISDVVVLPTDDTFLNSSPKEFLDYLRSLNPLAIVAGSDYSFGKNASGKIQDIIDYFTPFGVTIQICDIVKEKGVKVSSTNIRTLLMNGDISNANRFLSCPFFYSGVVKQGLQNGHKFGFPTVNIDIPKNKVSIKSGVYVTLLEINGNMYPAVTNVGSHPTFDFYGTNIETHALKAIEDEYGESIRVYFIKFIRDIKKFSNGEELSQQIEKDKEFAEKVIKDDKIWRGW